MATISAICSSTGVTELFQLVANPSKAKRNLGWEPQVSFEELLEKMLKTDLERLQSGALDEVLAAGIAPLPRV